MTDLSPESKALIELARDDDEPSAVDRARVRRALGTSLATGLAVSATTSVAAGAKAAAAGAGIAGSMKVAMWVGVGMAVGALSTTTAIVALRGQTPAPAPAPRSAPRAPSPEIHADPPVEDAPAVTAEAPTIPLEVTAKSVTPKGPQPSSSSLAAEMRLLETARAALSGGDARRALALIEEHERGYPGGALTEERRASKVFALCELGRRAEAARAASEFLRSAPASPLRGRVLDSCAFMK